MLNYLKHTDFKNTRSRQKSFFTRTTLDNKEASELIHTTKKKLFKKSPTRTLDIIKTSSSKRYVLKTSKLRHRNIRLRITFGLKRFGSYDRFIAEINNQQQLLDTPYIPKLVAYAYRKNKLGIVTHTAIITEYKEDTKNLIEHLDNDLNNIERLFNISFDLTLQHLQDNHIHLDLGPTNIIINNTIDKAYLIDTELFKCQSNKDISIEQKLGFCIGFLFKSGLNRYMPISEYIDLCEAWIEKFDSKYNETIFFTALLDSVKFHYGKKIKLTTF